MRVYRRDFLGRAVMIAAAGIFAGLTPYVSHALNNDDASQYVQATLDEVTALISSSGDTSTKATQLLAIMERRAAMPKIARFAAGVAWRQMSEDQQTRYVTAFGKFISSVYARRFQEYASNGQSNDETFELGRVIDAGRKGMLVKSSIIRKGEAPVVVEWLVTDRPGRIVIADIVIEGISMLITEREEIGSMLEARGGDIEKLIADLNS